MNILNLLNKMFQFKYNLLLFILFLSLIIILIPVYSKNNSISILYYDPYHSYGIFGTFLKKLTHNHENISAEIAYKLNYQDKINLKKILPGTVYIENDGDEKTFDNNKTFPFLKKVILSSNNNNILLNSLATNFPEISYLAILQNNPIAPEALYHLKQFKKLKFLELSCPFKNANVLIKVLPTNLTELSIRCSNLSITNERLNLNLPELKQLSIENCIINTFFLNSIHADKLESVNLSYINFNSELFECLIKFKVLKELTLIGIPEIYKNRIKYIENNSKIKIFASYSLLGNK